VNAAWAKAEAAAAALHSARLAPATRTAYERRIKIYTDFCTECGRIDATGDARFDERTIRAFIGHAMAVGPLCWAAGTVRSFVSALAEHCSTHEIKCALENQGSRRRIYETVDGGAKQDHQRDKQTADEDSREPLTPAHAADLLALGDELIPAEQRRVFPAYLLTVSTLLGRSGNFLAPAYDSFDPRRTLARGGVTIVHGSHVRVELPGTKTKARKVALEVMRTDGPRRGGLDAYTTLVEYARWRLLNGPRADDSPFFIIDDGRPYTQPLALKTLRALAAANGDAGNYALHSLRSGGAVAMTSAGASQLEVMAAGMWRSPKTAAIYTSKIPRNKRRQLQERAANSEASFSRKARALE
jgi:hypothetical protein